ncbi:MAG: hemerythrin domain-containing protein [Alphaproteobacteria bacterium]|jgi:DUF438 domain-containing protein|nr:hemerythrin domain-containing protein [Alphaproteobacteria bacterium]
MEYQCHVTRVLHEEHLQLLALLNRFEDFLVRHRKAKRLDTDQIETASLLRDLVTTLDAEVDRHFSFEETELFPSLEEAGDAMIATVLRADHEILRPLAREIAGAARTALAETLEGTDLDSFRQQGMEYVERQMTHIQREEMALLPLLEDLIDEETDQRLRSDYAAA